MGVSSPVVFPLFPVVFDETGSPACGCGNASCARVGKHPAVAWGDLSFGDAVPRPEEGAGAGLKTGAAPKGSGVFVVDVDSDDAIIALAEIGDLPDTFTVETGRGVQFYYAHPGFPVRNSAGDLVPGVDIRGDGGFVVAPGSPHKSGKTYVVLDAQDPVPAPAWLLEWLRARPAPAAVQSYDGDVTAGPERDHRRRLYTEYLKTTPPCVQGQAGDERLFEVVQRGAWDMALPVDDVLELVREHFDPRCQPPWGDELDERVSHKAHSAKTSSTRPRAEPPPVELADVFGLTMPDPPPAEPPDPRRRPAGIVWGAWEEPVDPPTYLVHGLAPIETVGMFVAMGSSLKTWTALDMGLAIARGVPWLGRYATRPGKVLVVDYESGAYELRRRVHLLKGQDVGDAFGAWAMPTGPGSRIDEEDFWKRLAGACDWGGGLVIVDSLAAGAPNVDENDARVATPLKYASRFTEGTGAAVLFIHHARKDDGGDDRKAVRGSTAIFADCDWVYKFENIEETKAYRRMHMCSIKPCMGPRPAPVHLELTDENGLAWFDEGEAVKAAAEDDTPASIQAAIRLALAAGSVATRAKLAAAVGKRGERVGREIDEMIVRREIAIVPGQGYVIDSPSAREARVRALLASPDRQRQSLSVIGKAAGVSTDDMSLMMSAGVICRSGEGRYLAVERSS